MSHEAGDPASSPMRGRVIAGRFEIERLLGEGGMGAVYLARQLSMDRLVALKLLHPRVMGVAGAVERFEREMRASSRIEHPNTIRVFDYGATDDGHLFLAMEYLGGRTLASVLGAGERLPLDRIVRIGVQVARALAAAHQVGVVHRDLKPDNIILLDKFEADFVKVLDFGIAHVEGEPQTQLTTEGAVIGTPAYMSPEQAMGRPVDARSDLYALGVLLYRMATGRVPFSSPTMVSVLVMHAREPPPAPSSVVGGVVPALEGLILALLEKDPDRRPQTATEVIARLEAIGPAAAPPARRPRPPWAALAVVAFALVAVVAGVRATLRPGQDGQAERERARLDEQLGAAGDPPAPASCRATSGPLVALLSRAAGLLGEGGPAAPRPSSAEAAALLCGAPITDRDPGAAEYFALLARAQLAQGDASGAAKEAAEQAARLCPGYALAHSLRGRIAQRQGRLDDARGAYEEAIRLAPDYATPAFNLALVHLQQGNPATARPLLEGFVGHHPDDGVAWKLLGQARAQGGLATEAREAFCRARALGDEESARLCPESVADR